MYRNTDETYYQEVLTEDSGVHTISHNKHYTSFEQFWTEFTAKQGWYKCFPMSMHKDYHHIARASLLPIYPGTEPWIVNNWRKVLGYIQRF